jgi:hypothetical protein
MTSWNISTQAGVFLLKLNNEKIIRMKWKKDIMNESNISQIIHGQKAKIEQQEPH